MATLPSSGAISLNDIQNVMGGTNPISMSEYYRGGAYVPATKTVTVNEGPSYQLGAVGGANAYYWLDRTGTNTELIYWNAIVTSKGPTITATAPAGATSVTVSGITYTRGAFVASSRYEISRSFQSTTNINTNVPTSGTISISNFYGAEKP